MKDWLDFIAQRVKRLTTDRKVRVQIPSSVRIKQLILR
jgi:hypothetical protein